MTAAIPPVGREKRSEQRPINHRGECDIVISASLIPFHQYAEDHGNYVLAERAREAHSAPSEDPRQGPSENAD
jgi:hypothetical protein